MSSSEHPSTAEAPPSVADDNGKSAARAHHLVHVALSAVNDEPFICSKCQRLIYADGQVQLSLLAD